MLQLQASVPEVRKDAKSNLNNVNLKHYENFKLNCSVALVCCYTITIITGIRKLR